MTHPDKPTPWFESAAARTKTHFNGESDLAAETERRVLDAVTRRKRKPKAIWLLPITLIGSGSLAWAEEVELAVQWTVEQVQELVQAEVAAPEAPTAAAGDTKPAAARHKGAAKGFSSSHEQELPPASAVDAITAETSEAATAAAGAEPSVSPTPSESLPGDSHPSPSSARIAMSGAKLRGTVEAAPPSASAPATAEPSDLERYHAGYAAQYERHDYGAALVAWNAYLQHVPGGRFTPDVRYNRAVALAELGRKQEAIAALAPFAAGAYGPLRQQSATKLTRKLSAESETVPAQ